ncbi:MAG TPA: VOC family protein [Leadbetterella sp.]|nr:VOC family protein [Leadbetterella sp.]
MKLIPLLKVKNIVEAVDFYTNILDFELKYPNEELNIFCVSLINGQAEFQLTETDGFFGVSVSVFVDNVDVLFKKFLKRGLITPKKENSPVHEGPIDQTWGTREFYVTDTDGNTLRYCMPKN